ncbi:MAG: RNA polymerase sigma factor, partial [Bacteroidales bacterium]|nr:RNA polymerase sigma factor [Bacteroidales bacterium]
MENNYTIRQQNAEQQTAELIARFKGNDTKAFNELYHMHVNMLFNYGSRLTQDAELLKDCIQDVFIRIYHRRAEIENIQNLKSYLLISLKNKLCDESRRRIHLSDVAVEELSVMACEHVEKDYITRESANNLKHKVSRLLDKLSPRQRDAIE